MRDRENRTTRQRKAETESVRPDDALTNIGVSLLLALIQLGSLSMGTRVTAHYWVSTVIEVGTALGIAWLAYRWRPARGAV